MAFQLAPCTNTDMDRAFAIISDSFGHEHPYIEYVFPDHDTPVGRKVGAERIRAIKNSDLSTTYLKVTNTDTGVIVAVAKWNIYDGVIPEEVQLDGDYWETETKKELAREIFAGYLRPRQEAIREAGGRLVSLDMLCVDPAYQRQGAGRMLVRWGTQVADRMGVKTVVESTPQGHGLYESEGFQVEIERYTVQLSENFAGQATQTFAWMVRPTKTSS